MSADPFPVRTQESCGQASSRPTPGRNALHAPAGAHGGNPTRIATTRTSPAVPAGAHGGLGRRTTTTRTSRNVLGLLDQARGAGVAGLLRGTAGAQVEGGHRAEQEQAPENRGKGQRLADEQDREQGGG